MSKAKPWGLVLAGGAGRRMGRSKGDLVLAGRPLAERAARALEPLCADVLVSIRPGARNPAPGRRTIEDAPPAGRGPLAGLQAAFEVAGSSELLVLGCDYPAVETALLARLLARARRDDDVTLPVDGTGRDHPLVGLWRPATAAAVARALAEGQLRVAGVLAVLRVGRLDAACFPGIDLERALLNLNRPEDLEA